MRLACWHVGAMAAGVVATVVFMVVVQLILFLLPLVRRVDYVVALTLGAAFTPQRLTKLTHDR